MSTKFLRVFIVSVLVVFAATGVFAQKAVEKALAPEALLSCDSGNFIDVEASQGTALAGYSTLRAAFAAINAGTHRGSINIELCAAIIAEGQPANLNSSGAGAASYNAISIYPLLDNVNITGTPDPGFGVIQFNGADRVTLEGDNPLTPGPNRNLTIKLGNGSDTIGGSVVRVATSPGAPTANDLRINNVNIVGNVENGNSPFFNAPNQSPTFSYCIYVGGGGGVTATDAPTPITSPNDSAPTGTTVNNFIVNLNSITTCGQGVAFNGQDATVSDSVEIMNNEIGDQTTNNSGLPPYEFPRTTVYSKGISIAGAADVYLFRNSIRNIMSHLETRIEGIEIGEGVGHVMMHQNSVLDVVKNGQFGGARGVIVGGANTSFNILDNDIQSIWSLNTGPGTAGLDIQSNSSSGTIDSNLIREVYNTNPGTWGAFGLNVNAGDGFLIQNNMIAAIAMNVDSGNAFSTSFGVHGLRVGGGVNHKIYNNSVSITGNFFGLNGNNILSSAFSVVQAGSTGLDVRNNIFLNTANPGFQNVSHVAVYLPSGLDSSINLNLNYNDYYSGIAAQRQALAQVGTTPGVGQYTLGAFNPNTTTPVGNFRSYSSTLSPSGTNDFNSMNGNPNFFSTLNLHLPAASFLQDSGDASVRIYKDYDGQIRTAQPDIGADELNGLGPFADDIAATDFNTPTNGQLFVGDATFTPQATFRSLGSSTVNDKTFRFTITGPNGYNYVDTKSLPFISSGDVVTINFAPAPTITGNGQFTMRAEVVTADSYAGDDIINGTFRVSHPMSGAYNVPGDFPSLTNAGGAFDILNNAGMAGNVIINISSDLFSETGAVALNEIAGGHTLTVQSSGAARLIEGDAPGSLINFNGADRVIFSGLAFGPRGLTIRNTNTVSGSVFLYTNDASNNSIVSCNIEQNNLSPAVSFSFANTTGNLNNAISDSLIHGIGASNQKPTSGIQSNSASYVAPNAGLIIMNNEIRNFAQNGIAFAGGNRDFQITGNLINSDSDRQSQQIGIYMAESQGTSTITGNTIRSLRTSVNAVNNVAIAGMILNNVQGMTVKGNKINDFRALTGATGNIVGIGFNGASGTSASATVINNMIKLQSFTDVTQTKYTGLLDNGFAGNTLICNHNTVYMEGQSGATSSWAFLRAMGAAGDTTLRNNILANMRTGGGATAFAAGDQNPGVGTFDTNYNYFAGRAVSVSFFMDIGTDPNGTPVTPTTWVNGPPQRDTISDFILPANFTPSLIFFSPFGGELHLLPTAGPDILSAGSLTNVNVTDDFDGDPRPISYGGLDRGADELIKSLSNTPIPAGNYFNVAFRPGNQYEGDITVRGQLSLDGAATPTNSNFVIDLPCDVFIMGAGENGYVAGKVRRNFCQSMQSGYLFPVGAGSGYSPVNLSTNAGTTYPSSLTINAVDDFLPGLLQVNGVSRYWIITETGNVNADLAMTYRDSDVNGNEANYKAFRRSGGVNTMVASTPQPADNYVYVANVTTFSDWGIGTLVPTAAEGEISGRVLTADGRPIANCRIVLAGSGLAEPRAVVTGHLGFYTFTDVPVGESYVVTVESKRFSFLEPTRLISLSENVTGADFIAIGQ